MKTKMPKFKIRKSKDAFDDSVSYDIEVAELNKVYYAPSKKFATELAQAFQYFWELGFDAGVGAAQEAAGRVVKKIQEEAKRIR